MDDEGEPRAAFWRTFGVAPSSFSMTPNSLVERLTGEGFAEDVATRLLALLVARAEVECFKGGDDTADDLLEIRGILVGVSFGRPEVEFINDEGGSRVSFNVCELLVPVVPTEGEPAIVGSWLRARREVSDCFCKELTV